MTNNPEERQLVEKENHEASVREYNRELADNLNEDESEQKRKQFQDVVGAVDRARTLLSVKELGTAITQGLWTWPRQVQVMLELLKEIAWHTGEPLEVVNRADEHQDE